MLQEGEPATFGRQALVLVNPTTNCSDAAVPLPGTWYDPEANGSAPLPIVYNNAPGPLTVGSNFIAFDLDPVGPALPLGGSVYLPPAGWIVGDVFTLAGGSGFSLLNLPAGFPGYLVVLQAVAIDNTNVYGFSLSNAGVLLTQ